MRALEAATTSSTAPADRNAGRETLAFGSRRRADPGYPPPTYHGTRPHMGGGRRPHRATGVDKIFGESGRERARRGDRAGILPRRTLGPEVPSADNSHLRPAVDSGSRSRIRAARGDRRALGLPYAGRRGQIHVTDGNLQTDLPLATAKSASASATARRDPIGRQLARLQARRPGFALNCARSTSRTTRSPTSRRRSLFKLQPDHHLRPAVVFRSAWASSRTWHSTSPTSQT